MAITPRSTLTEMVMPVGFPSMCQIEPFKDNSYLIEQCAKKKTS